MIVPSATTALPGQHPRHPRPRPGHWKVLRFTAVQVLHRPWEVAAGVRYELVQAARRQGTGLDRVQLY